MKRNGWVLFLIFVAALSVSFHSPAFDPANGKIQTIVIDAGHGGKDPGCRGKFSWEKNVTLSIAQELEDILNENLPHIDVVLTRDHDTFVELHKRAQTAGEKAADFFVSIHCNANDNHSAHGTETFVVGMHKNDAKLNMIMSENSVILQEENHEEHYDGFDPDSPEAYIIFQLMNNAYLKQSLMLAENVETEFSERAKRYSRGVKQAGFLVLWRSPTPSILIETGFLTNPEEEKFLNSDEGRSYIASAIYRAIKSYNEQID